MCFYYVNTGQVCVELTKNTFKRITLTLLIILCSVFFSYAPIRAQAESETLASYTTYFNAQDKGRTQNITIAVSLIDGVTLQAYGEFSFNQTHQRGRISAGENYLKRRIRLRHGRWGVSGKYHLV